MLAVAGGFLFSGVKRYLSYRAAFTGTEESIQQAIRLSPGNAQFHYAYGRMLALAMQEAEKSVPHFREAARLNPHSSQYWRGLAMAYQLTGNLEEQKKALDEAVRVDPKTPLVAQEVGDFYLIRGELRPAFQQYRVVLESEPQELPAMLELGWKATDGDTAFLFDNLIPANDEMRAQLLRLAMAKDSPDSAQKAFEKLASLGKPIDAKLTAAYVSYMIRKKEPDAASAAWAQMVALDQKLGDYRSSAQNNIVNGGFELGLLNGGFDWALASHPGVRHETDTTDFHGGNRALSVNFDGSIPRGLGVMQFVAVRPNTAYRLDFWWRGRELASAAAPRILVYDFYPQHAIATSEEMRGSTVWQQTTLEFTTGPDTRLIAIQLVRTSDSALIRGKLLLDDFRLVAQ